jgi:DNA-binding transcriptional LysR family regulator
MLRKQADLQVKIGPPISRRCHTILRDEHERRKENRLHGSHHRQHDKRLVPCAHARKPVKVGYDPEPENGQMNVDEQPLHYDQLFVVAGALSKWARQRRIALSDLAEEAWVQWFPEMEPGSPCLEAFRAAGLPAPRVMIRSGSMNWRYGLLATGRFITMIPDSVLHYGAQRRSIRILPVKIPRWRQPIDLAA